MVSVLSLYPNTSPGRVALTGYVRKNLCATAYLLAVLFFDGANSAQDDENRT
jgi:hypothetical protein